MPTIVWRNGGKASFYGLRTADSESAAVWMEKFKLLSLLVKLFLYFKNYFLKTIFLDSLEFPCHSIIRKRVMNDPSNKKKVIRKLLSQCCWLHPQKVIGSWAPRDSLVGQKTITFDCKKLFSLVFYSFCSVSRKRQGYSSISQEVLFISFLAEIVFKFVLVPTSYWSSPQNVIFCCQHPIWAESTPWYSNQAKMLK